MIEALLLLNALSEDLPHYCGDYSISILGDASLPLIDPKTPDHPLLQRDWIWIAKVGWKPVAFLMAAPTQGVAFLMRIYATKEAPKSVFVGLLRKCLADIHARGYSQFLVPLSLDRSEEKALARVIKRAGGKELGNVTIFTGGTLNRW